MDCFVHRLQSCNNSGLEGASKIVDVLCATCEAPLDRRLLQLLPPSAMAICTKAIAEHAIAARSEVDRNRDRTRFAAHRSDNLTFRDKLYNLEREVTAISGDKKLLLVGAHSVFFRCYTMFPASNL